jgi:sugar (pentulose or hexulose) kinase
LGSKTNLAVGLDLGSSSTRVVICAVEERGLRFLGHGEAPVQAWNKSRLTDQDALAQSIRFALHEAEVRAQASPDSALIGVGGCVTGVNTAAAAKSSKAICATPWNWPRACPSMETGKCCKSARRISHWMAAPATVIPEAFWRRAWKPMCTLLLLHYRNIKR